MLSCRVLHVEGSTASDGLTQRVQDEWQVVDDLDYFWIYFWSLESLDEFFFAY